MKYEDKACKLKVIGHRFMTSEVYEVIEGEDYYPDHMPGEEERFKELLRKHLRDVMKEIKSM